MLVILNPFAQALYLAELMNRLEARPFIRVHLSATALSYFVFVLFALTGDFLLRDIFRVRLASLQIFGGLIMLFIAYRYVVGGPGSNLLFRGDISDLAPRISLPYMVGPGTLWVAILVGRRHTIPMVLLIIGAALAINFIFVLLYRLLHDRLTGRNETTLGKYIAILMRTNALFIGGVAVEMIVGGFELFMKGTAGSGD